MTLWAKRHFSQTFCRIQLKCICNGHMDLVNTECAPGGATPSLLWLQGWQMHARGKRYFFSVFPSKHGTLTQCWLMSAHRLQRWANISQALAQRLVFAGSVYLIKTCHVHNVHQVGIFKGCAQGDKLDISARCCFNVGPVSQTMVQH